MIKSISNFKIDSITLERTPELSGDLILNKAQISTSFETVSSLKQLQSLNLRLFISLDKEASKVLDFVTQRYDEYLRNSPSGVSSQQLNDFLQRSLGTESTYLKSSNPFSPYSTDLEARNLVITNRVSKFGEGKSIPHGVVIYDVPVMDAYSKTDASNNSRLIGNPITIELPTMTKDIAQMSVYAFLYDSRLPRVFKDSPQNNFAINTGMSLPVGLTPVGDKVEFLASSPAVPLLGMEVENTLLNPDSQILRVVEKSPEDAANEQYVNLEEESKRMLTSYRFDRANELNKTIKKENYFSNLWLSTDTRGNCKFVFAFDLRSYLKLNAIFPFVYQSDRLAASVITGGDDISPNQLSSVIYTEVVREPLEKNGFISISELGTVGRSVAKVASETFPHAVVPNVKKVNINLFNSSISSNTNDEICFYEGVDDFGYSRNPNRQISGRFQYTTRCTIRDNSPDLVRNLTKLMMEIKRTTSSIHSFLTSPASVTDEVPNYNSDTGLLLRDIRNINMVLDGKTINIYSVLIQNILKYQSFIGSLNSKQQTMNVLEYYENSLQASEGRINPNIIKDFENVIISAIKFLEDKLTRVFPMDPYGSGEDRRNFNFAHNGSKSVRNNILTTQHAFSEIHEKGYKSGFGIDYIFDHSEESKSINALTLQSYESRRVDEFKKYFSGGKGSAQIVPDGSYEDASYAYMTPKTITTPNRPLIDQTKYATDSSLVVEYDYDRYGQLFGDILELSRLTEVSNVPYPPLSEKPSGQGTNNKLYSSVTSTLSKQFGLNIREILIPQFSAPRVSTEKSTPTIYNTNDFSGCGNLGGAALLPSVIGGESAKDSSTVSYFETVDNNIKNEDTERLKGDIDIKKAAQDRKERAIRLPIAILGELTLNKSIDLTNDMLEDTYNSLTALGEILDISKKNISQALESAPGSLLPNQLKSMLVIASTNEGSALGETVGGESFDACRPRLNNPSTDNGSTDLISFYGDDTDVPPYPETKDPMRSYAQFLAFWMNYKKIGVVEYLHGFDTLLPSQISNETGQKVKLPVWSMMSPSTAQQLQDQGGAVLCRVRSMSTADYLSLMGDNLSVTQREEIIKFFETREILNLPTYNEYFYIQGGDTSTANTSTANTSTAGY